jgi:hypothetical protein
MKNVSLILLSLLTMSAGDTFDCAAAQQPTPKSGSASMTRWHPPAIDVTKDEEPKPVPLTNLLGSLTVSSQTFEVYLKNLVGLELTVHNGTDRPLVVDAEKCIAELSEVKFHSVGAEQIDYAVRHPHSLATGIELKAARITVAAVSIGAYQTITDFFVQAGPVLKRYGVDEKRREIEERAFGSRVVWPGETSSGIVYFPGDTSLRGAMLNIPVHSLFDPTDQATVRYLF